MDPSVGQKAIRSITLTVEHVRAYAEMTGDHNPLHFDEDFTSKTKFKKLVVQGGLTTGLLHALVAMDMPGAGTVFLSQNWKFISPVFIGDTIYVEMETIETKALPRIGGGSVTIVLEVKNQNEEVCHRGSWTVLMMSKPK